MYVSLRPAGKHGDFNAYILKSYRKDDGSTSTETVLKLGRLSAIAKEHPGVDPREWLERLASKMTQEEEATNEVVVLRLSPTKRIGHDNRRVVHGGDLLLNDLFYEMGLDKICSAIDQRGKFKFDFTDIMKKIVFGRILFPDSKLGTWQQAQSFINKPKFELEDIYKALGVMARESDFIQSSIFKNTNAVYNRNTDVIYYDCTNYFFEVEQADKEAEECINVEELKKAKNRGLRKYGHSKENRPAPIVQLGMFMDSDGLPLAFCINPGNTAETQTLIPLEEKLANDFSLSKFVCSTDGGLGSRENRKYNTTEGREYITVQSLKGTKVESKIRDWALKDEGWHISGFDGEYTIEEAKELLGDKFTDTTLIKDRWFKVGNDGFEEHYIITYSQKYANYTKRTRDAQVARALKMLASGADLSKKSQNDCRRFIKSVAYTNDGEAAQNGLNLLDQEKIQEEAKYDGIYAIATSLEDAPSAVLRANHYRFEIEHLFRITKTDLELRPIYLSRTDRIIGHFITCFIALLMLKIMQKKVNDGHEENDLIPVEQIRESLSQIKYLYHESAGYEPSFNNNETIIRMQVALGKIIDTQIISRQKMKSLLRKPLKIKQV